jgi:hypothetical protein
MTHGMPDNIDAFKENLLEKLMGQGYFDDVPDLIDQSSTDSVSVNISNMKMKNES